MMNKLKSIIKEINNAGGTVYYVGGYIRDKFLNRENKDIDVEIHNITVKEVEEILSHYGKVDLVGKSFGVLKVRGLDIDFAFPRTEKKVGEAHTDFEVTVDPFLPIEIAAKRRDFTMNAIMEDAMTGEIVDPYNGVEALKEGVIKFVNKDTFIEDPLRPLRAAQFAARFNMVVDPSVIMLSRTLDYTTLSVERIEGELNKGFKAENPSVMFRLLNEMGVLEQIAPEFKKLETIEQSLRYHPEGNVFEHTMLVIDQARYIQEMFNLPMEFMYASLIHDIGKLNTTRISPEGKISHINHEVTGVSLSTKVLSGLVKTNVTKYVEMFVLHHMLAHNVLKMKQIKLQRLMVRVPIIRDVILFGNADTYKGGNKEAHFFNEEYQAIKARMETLGGKGMKIKAEVTGKDLLELGLKPGPKFQELINESLELKFNGKTKSEALAIFKNRKAKGKL